MTAARTTPSPSPRPSPRPSSAAPSLVIPEGLRPRDGRFGAGPSKVRAEQVEALRRHATTLLGTSHRQAPVRTLVREVREGLKTLFDLPDGHEVVLGNGGSTAFWDVAALCLVERRAQHLVFGEFGAKFAAVTGRAPFLDDPDVRTAEPGGLVAPAAADVDVYAWPHNETSTGIMAPLTRPEGGTDALLLVDGTSAAGGLPADLADVDVYYFAPQKSFASDGGLWCAILSPRALERTGRIATSGRWVPAFLDLPAAIAASRKDQTINTPAIATLVLMAEQLRWMNDGGGLPFTTARSAESAARVYAWAHDRSWATPFVTDPAARSHVVTTTDLDEGIDAAAVAAALRANGIVDVEPYRGLARNQLRIATFPAIDPDDVSALLACVDHVVEQLRTR